MYLGGAWLVVLAMVVPMSLILRFGMPRDKVKLDKESLTAGELYDRWQ